MSSLNLKDGGGVSRRFPHLTRTKSRYSPSIFEPSLTRSHFLTNCSEWRYRQSSNYLAESSVSRAVTLVAQGVAFADFFNGDDGV
jgi:hypothetical protein